MRSLLDISNIENVLKFYRFTDRESGSINGNVHNIPGFSDFSVDFSKNFNLWEENKAHIFKLFGNKLKITKELGVQNVCTVTMVNDFKEDFLIANGKYLNILIKIFLQSLSGEEILKNKIRNDIQVLDVLLKKNMKVTKCFALLELNKKRLTAQQNLYSTFLQSLYVKGRLVLSIDPLDYITMSVSKSGWSSCHHPHGEYGTGPLSYMNDKATIIAYIETVDPISVTVYDEEIGENITIKMPNKIWRQVVTINKSHDYILQLRQYPNSSEIYNSTVSNLLKELLEKESGENYNCDKRQYDNIRNAWYLQEESSGTYETLFYCDFANNNFQVLTSVMKSRFGDIESLIKSIKEGEIQKISIGENVYCACGCGSHNYSKYAFVEDYDNEGYDEDYNEDYDD